MVSHSLPQESRTVGLGINTMLRNLGAAIGPVLATTIMASYTTPMVQYINGQNVVVDQLPSSFAFYFVSGLGIFFTVLIVAVSLSIKNYSFRKKD